MKGVSKKLTTLAIIALLAGMMSIGIGPVQADDDLNSILLWSAVGSPGGADSGGGPFPVTITSTSVSLEFEAGDTAVLSSTPEGLGAFFTDDEIHINGVNVCTGPAATSCFAFPTSKLS